MSSAAYILAEEESNLGESRFKIFAGCEFVSGRDRENIQMLAMGPRWRRELGGPGGSFNRATFKEIAFPAENISF